MMGIPVSENRAFIPLEGDRDGSKMGRFNVQQDVILHNLAKHRGRKICAYKCHISLKNVGVPASAPLRCPGDRIT